MAGFIITTYSSRLIIFRRTGKIGQNSYRSYSSNNDLEGDEKSGRVQYGRIYLLLNHLELVYGSLGPLLHRVVPGVHRHLAHFGKRIFPVCSKSTWGGDQGGWAGQTVERVASICSVHKQFEE